MEMGTRCGKGSQSKWVRMLAWGGSVNLGTLCLASAILSPNPHLSAQVLEPPLEITVTASALDQSAFEIPASLTIIEPSEMQRGGSDHLQDILDQAPSLTWSGGTSRPRYFQIRGIGEFEQYEGAPNPSVGLIVDDVDLSGLGAAPALFDIARTEVLRGPQPTRYGSSALAGVLALRSQDPSQEFSGHSEFSLGSDDLIAGGVAVGGPLDGMEKALQIHLSAYQHLSDGYRRNLFLDRDDTNERDELTTRAKIRVAPSDQTTIVMNYFRIGQNNGYDTFAINNAFTTQSDRPGRDDLTTDAGALKVENSLSDDFSLVSITTASHTEQRYDFDGDWGNNPFWEPFAPYDYQSLTNRGRDTLGEEVRLRYEDSLAMEPLRGVIGGYVHRLVEDSDIDERADMVSYEAVTSDYEARTGAVFGELDIPLGGRWWLTAGARSERRLSEYSDTSGAQFSPGETFWGGSAALRFEASEETQLYLQTSRGFKGGGFNPGTRVSSDRRQFGPESLWNIEGGVRSEIIPGILSGDISVFTMIRRDQQIKLALQDDPTDPLAFTYLTDNAARGWNSGVESVVRAAVSDAFSLRCTGSLLATEISSVDPALSTLEGRDQSHAPSWQYSVTGRYQPWERWYLESTVRGMDAFYYDDSHDARSTPYHILDMSLGYDDGQFSWSLWARNAFDERYAVRGFYFGLEPPDYSAREYIQRGDPFQIGTTVRIKF